MAESVYEERGLLSFAPDSVQTGFREPPSHPYLSGMVSFCGACPRYPLEARCDGCPVTAAEVAQLQAYRDAQPAGEPCLMCGHLKSKRRRRPKENP